MSWQFTVNQNPSGGPAAIFNLKTALKAQGWTVPRSSDGTTYNAAGDQITQAGTSAGGMSNAFAWFVIQEPSGVRQWCFQRATGVAPTGNENWRIKASGAAGFTGGSPGATQTPSATDEVILLGAGTDAAPTMAQLMSGAVNGTRQNIGVGQVGERYAWYMLLTNVGLTTTNALLMHDTLQANGYVSADTDPCVYVVMPNTATVLSNAQASPVNTARAYLGAVATANFVGMSLPVYGAYVNTSAFPGGVSTSPWNGKDVAVPQMWTRPANSTAPQGFKGFSGVVLAGSVQRTNMDTLDVLSTKDRIFVNGYWLPWNGSTPTL